MLRLKLNMKLNWIQIKLDSLIFFHFKFESNHRKKSQCQIETIGLMHVVCTILKFTAAAGCCVFLFNVDASIWIIYWIICLVVGFLLWCFYRYGDKCTIRSMLISRHNTVSSSVRWFCVMHTKTNEIVMAFLQRAIIVRNVTYSF